MFKSLGYSALHRYYGNTWLMVVVSKFIVRIGQVNPDLALYLHYHHQNTEFTLYPWRAIEYVQYMRANNPDNNKFVAEVANHIEGWLIQERYLKSPLPGSPLLIHTN